MTLTRKDLGATVLAALVVLVYVANIQSWWYRRIMGPVGGFPMIVVALASGVVALQAIFRDGERALTVFAALVWFLLAAALLAELLIALVLTLA